jgi:hypothetical protein
MLGNKLNVIKIKSIRNPKKNGNPGHRTGRDEKKIVDGRRDGTGQKKLRPAGL